MIKVSAWLKKSVHYIICFFSLENNKNNNNIITNALLKDDRMPTDDFFDLIMKSQVSVIN